VVYNQSRAADPWLADMIWYKRRVQYRKKRRTRGLGSNQFREVSGVPASKHPSLQWGLGVEEYTRLVTSECFYCGRPPHQKLHSARGTGLKRNGIDRVDNARGYEPDNCVSCCTLCNRAKRALPQSDFIEDTRRRYEYLKARGRL